MDKDQTKKEINDILLALQNGKIDVGEAAIKLNEILAVHKNILDIAYILGVINTGGIDVLSSELNRLKNLEVTPSDMVFHILLSNKK